MSQLWQRRQQLDDCDVQVVILSFDRPELAVEYLRQSGITWPMLLDPDKKLYAEYTLGAGSWWSIAGPVSIYKYVRLLLAGQKLQPSGNDYWQLGADVLIGPDHIIRHHQQCAGPHDRPNIDAWIQSITHPDSEVEEST